MQKTLHAFAAGCAATLAMPAAAQHMDHTMPMQQGTGDHSDSTPRPLFTAGSGTSRQPLAAIMPGIHVETSGWMLMAHGYAWTSYVHESGRRGDDMTFVQSMAMVEASRPLDGSTRLQLRAMASLDPLMGRRGYPNLLATGETAHGAPLVDRQHPHDLAMELSARIDHDVAPGTSLFVYAGLPGEPAIGPTTFMHRASSRFLPQAPIGHHWFDSTHITFGVVTAGVSTRHWQAELSAFNGREPDERRWNIESPRLDSWAARLSWSPSPRWTASLSYAELQSPERLHPNEDEARLVASIAYVDDRLAATAGWSHKDRQPGRSLDAAFVEATYTLKPHHAVFGRVERLRNDELFGDDSPFHNVPFTVAKATLGYAYTVPLGDVASLSLGGAANFYALPDRLGRAYGHPHGFLLFARLGLGGEGKRQSRH
ncbi:MAG TPA: hypothetical protein VNZ43_14010 [Sphingomonadaceae bacterium]|nr:hypothetical protein [Sphingomonadaceae bacterium]